MFTIDLLKGEAVPLKGTPGCLVIVAIAAAVPIAAAAGMFGRYQDNRQAVSLAERETGRLDDMIGRLTYAVDRHKALEKQKADLEMCLSEVRSLISRHTQWSPILATLMENIPETVMLTSLEIEHDSVRIKRSRTDDPKKQVEVSVPVRILRLTVCGEQQSNPDEAVKDFINRLWTSGALGPRLDNIGHSQEHVELDGRQLISYEIICRFKPEL